MSDEETGQRPDWAKRYIDEVMAHLTAELGSMGARRMASERTMYHPGLGLTFEDLEKQLWDAITKVGEQASDDDKWRILESRVKKLRATRNIRRGT